MNTRSWKSRAMAVVVAGATAIAGALPASAAPVLTNTAALKQALPATCRMCAGGAAGFFFGGLLAGGLIGAAIARPYYYGYPGYGYGYGIRIRSLRLWLFVPVLFRRLRLSLRWKLLRWRLLRWKLLRRLARLRLGWLRLARLRGRRLRVAWSPCRPLRSGAPSLIGRPQPSRRLSPSCGVPPHR